MALSETEKTEIKTRWDAFVIELLFWAQGDTTSLYVVDGDPLSDARIPIMTFLAKYVRAVETRAAQGRRIRRRSHTALQRDSQLLLSLDPAYADEHTEKFEP